MNFYKKLIPKKMRFAILKMLRFIPDKPMISFQYRVKTGRGINWKNPKRYTEKIQWYKLNYKNDKMPICVDKYRVREYIEEKGLSDILVKLYAVYESPEEIKLGDLPEKFVLKTTNGSGTNIICRDKSTLDEQELKCKISSYFKQSSASAGREWPYKHVVPRIIVEELLEDNSTEDKSICDYKFLCFAGKPEYVVYDVDRFTEHKRNIYDTEWNDLHIASDCPCSDKVYEKPETLEKMLEIAKTLSADFPAVRVDLYSIEGKIYFGELTFFPWSGYVKYNPDSFDFEMGQKFILSDSVGG